MSRKNGNPGLKRFQYKRTEPTRRDKSWGIKFTEEKFRIMKKIPGLNDRVRSFIDQEIEQFIKGNDTL